MLDPRTARRPWSVSELCQEIRASLRPLTVVFVKGEVSGMRRTSRDHLTFTIKDAAAMVDAVIWADTARRLPIVPEDGHEFLFRGKVDFWPQAGRLRLVVDLLEFDDVGRLRAQLEVLRHRLDQEGLFDPARKRPLPFLPECVALVTSPTGAVIHDLQETIWDRFPNLEVLVYPAQVQGTASPGSIVGALRRCNQEGRANVVIIARGGGSFEELYAFNTEPVARAILASRIPVVTALGHTSDRTIADMVADAECRTPTEAAARVVRRRATLAADLAERHRRLEREAGLWLQRHQAALAARCEHLDRSWPTAIRDRVQRLARCRAELSRLSPVYQIEARHHDLEARATRIRLAPGMAIDRRAATLAGRRVDRVATLVSERIGAARAGLDQRWDRLRALSPEAVLARGYSITQDAATGAVLRDATQVRRGGHVRVRLAAGGLEAVVEDVTS